MQPAFLNWRSESAQRCVPTRSPVQGRPDSASIKASKILRDAPPPRQARVPLFADAHMGDWRNADCTVDNLVYALETRVYIPTPQWQPPAAFNKVLRRSATRLGRQLGPPLDDEGVAEVLSRFPENKRKMYGLALNVKLNLRRCRCKAFVKDEWTKKKNGKVWKPRVIQFRDPEYLAHMLHFYKPIEHAFYHGRFLFNRRQKYTCAKGANPHQRLSYLRKLVSELNDPYVVDLDGSAFDAHVCQDALKAEWKFYELAAREAGWSNEKINLLRQYGKSQLVNKCGARLKDGRVSYRVDGNRMSGDLNTGNGNSVLQSLFIGTAMMELKVPEECFRFYVDGDDAVLFVEREYVDTIKTKLEGEFRKFSQELKVGEARSVLREGLECIEFCQSKPVCVNGEWRFVRNPEKVINCYLRTFRWSQSDQLLKRYFATVSPPEMIINSDVPILDKFFETLHTLSGDEKPLDSVARNYWRRTVHESELAAYQRRGVQDGTRESFYRAFGVAPDEQLLAEQLISTHRGKEKYL